MKNIKNGAMKFYKTSIIFFSFFIIFIIVFSCEDKFEPNYKTFLIKVDSIQVSDNIVINEPFEIILHGIIGTNGCYQFSQFITEEQGNNITIEAWGKYNMNSHICSAVMVSLECEKLNYLIKKKGIYTIKVKLPDKNYLVRQIIIE